MLQRLVELSIRHRLAVLLLAGALLAYGTAAARHAPLDVFPDFVQPQVTIQTEAPGLSPEQVETLVTQRVESAASGVPHVESLRSQSIQGLSVVSVYFEEGMDIHLARQLLHEQLTALADALPSGVKSPKLNPLVSATMDLLKIGLTSDRMSLMELRAFADWTLRPRMQAVEGVAQVGVMGGDVRELQVQVLPDRLIAYGLAWDDVVDAARRATGARGAAYTETPNQRVVVQTEGQALTAEELGESLLRRVNGVNLRLRDVARVVDAPQPKFGDVLIQGRPGVLVKLLSQYGSNTMEVTRLAEEAIAELGPVFKAEGIQVFPHMHRPATFIETAIGHVSKALFVGAGLVIVVLTLCMWNLRAALISITAIPLSLLAAVIVLERFGLTLNTITLGGLAIAIGEVVDDAIIDVENIFRRLRENRVAGGSRSTAAVVLDASVEVRSAVVHATLVVVLVFVPVLTMSGLQGRMFAPLGIAYISAILASLVVAMTATPALALLLLPRAAYRDPAEPRRLRAIKGFYTAVLARLAAWPRTLLLAAGVGAAVAALMLTRFGSEFLPEFREGHFVLQVSAVPGTSLPEMVRLGEHMSNDLQANVQVGGKPVIDTINFQAGRAEQGEDPWGPHRAELHVELVADVPGDDQADVQSQIRDRLEKYPGITYEVLTFLGDRISETISGETSSVVVNIFGDDLDALDDKAGEIAAELAKIHGAADVHVASPPGMPELRVKLREDRIAALGFRRLDALADIETAMEGARAAQVYEANREYDVRVILDETNRRDPELLAALPMRAADGGIATLGAIADITQVTGRYMILHEGARRRQTVMCNVEHRDLDSFVAAAKERVQKIALPAGYYVVFGGQAEAGAAARSELLLHSGIATLGILVVLSTAFGRGRNLLLLLLNLPFALIGGVVAVALTGATLSIGSIVGFVTLFGITLRNSVMMISHFEHLVGKEGVTWGREAMLRGASERLLPVVMTALVTGLGLLPIALGSGEVGREIEGPMAIVILGGLISSTLLNLLVLPVLTLRYGNPAPRNDDELPVAA